MSESQERQLDPPESSTGDTAYLVAQGVLSVIPGAAELFQYFVTPPIERRRQEWMRQVGQVLQDLQEHREVDLKDLQSDDAFIDTLLQASQVAVRNSQEEKRQALRNAILNAALPNPPEHALQQMFLVFIDILTVWHLQLLKLFQNPVRWAEVNEHQFPNLHSGGGLNNILESAFPELRNRRSFYDQLWNDLHQRGLVRAGGLHTTITSSGLMAEQTTELGNQFLNFIEEPQASTWWITLAAQ